MLDHLPIEILLHISCFLDTKSLYYLILTGFTFIPIIDPDEKRKRRICSLRKFNPLLEIHRALDKSFHITSYGILRNPCITYDIVMNHIREINIRNIKYHLIYNPNFTLEMILEIYRKVSKDSDDEILREYINYSVNITYDQLTKYKRYINYNYLSYNKSLPQKFVDDNPDKPWNRDYIIEIRSEKEKLFIISDDYNIMSRNPNVPFEYIVRNKDKPWDITLICMYNHFGY